MRQHDRKARTAERHRRGKSAPTRFAILLVGFLETFRRAHDAVFIMAAFFIARLVERLKNLFGEFRGVGENVVHQIGRQFIELRNVFECFQLKKFVDDELHVVDWRAIDRHWGFLLARTGFWREFGVGKDVCANRAALRNSSPGHPP